jgi:hypothetical protein
VQKKVRVENDEKHNEQLWKVLVAVGLGAGKGGQPLAAVVAARRYLYLLAQKKVRIQNDPDPDAY